MEQGQVNKFTNDGGKQGMANEHRNHEEAVEAGDPDYNSDDSSVKYLFRGSPVPVDEEIAMVHPVIQRIHREIARCKTANLVAAVPFGSDPFEGTRNPWEPDTLNE